MAVGFEFSGRLAAMIDQWFLLLRITTNRSSVQFNLPWTSEMINDAGHPFQFPIHQ